MKFTRTKIGGLVGLSSLLTISTLNAQEIAESDIDTLDPMVVIGTSFDGFEALGRGKLAGSYDIITRDELVYEHPDDTAELFSKLPGITISRYNQGIINSDLSIRGFAGDGTTPHAKLLIDGIPANLHNGFSELDQMFPMAIGGIEVFKGTSDVRYGLYNIAGNYNISSRTDLGREIQLTYGSFDAREIQGYWGLKSGALTHNYFVGWRETNGYRDHTDLTKYTFSGRWFYEFDDSTKLGFIARTSSYEGDSPGYLDRATSRTNPRSSGSFANQDGGEKSVDHFSLHFDKEWQDIGLSFSTKAYYQLFERDRFVRFNEDSDLQNRFDDQEMLGLISTFDWKFSDTWTLTGGFDYEYQDIVEQRFRTIGQSRERDVLRDRRYDLDILGGFVSIENTPTDWLRWNAGIRLDHLDGDFGQTAVIDYGVIVQPKLNIFVSLNESLLAFANAGRSFQHPFGTSLFDPARDVSINDGWELGLKWNPTDQFSLRTAYWQQLASDEFTAVDGNSLNVGETDRSGIDVSLAWNPTEELSIWGDYNHNFSEISGPGSAAAGTRGNRLRSIPDYTFSVGGSYKINDCLTARVHVDGQGSYHVNEANDGGTFGDYVLVNAGFDYKTESGLWSLQVNNLLDRDYEYVFDLGRLGTIHSPGDGLNASLSYTLEF